MINSSSLFKAVALVGTGAAVLLIDAIWTASIGFNGVLSSLVLPLVALVLLGGALFFLSRVNAVLDRAAKICEAAASGDLEARICEVPEPGMIGCIQRGINNMLDIADAFVREASYSAGYVSRSKFYRKVLLRGLPGSFHNAANTLNHATETMERKVLQFAQFADDFEAKVGGIVRTVASAATELQATAEAMAATADETSRQSNAVAAASEQATANVNTVSSATEELSASIKEITQQVGESTRIVGDGAKQATDTNIRVQRLKESVQKIDTVVNLINDIASQTNLLALNATIEAARAGEAGKGFAVVASEVKALATQTGKATEEIAAQIRGIQEETDLSVQSIETITQTIGQVSTIATSIAASVEEQGSATQEIARSVSQAAQGTTAVSSTITSVNEAAKQTGAAASQVLDAARELSTNGEMLKIQVDKFLREVRAA